MDAVMAAAPSDGGGSDADTGWLSDDTGPEAEDEGDRRESSGAVSSSGVERRLPQRPPDEDEPTLEYRLLGAGVSSLLEEDVASCAAAREDLFALGTKSGRVHVFSHAGDFCSRARRLSSSCSPLDRAREEKTHAAPVTGVAFDARGEHVASCAADGTVSVARLGRRRRPARERSAADPDPGVSVVFAGEHDCAALAVALDPRETDLARRCVVVGLADGRLVVRTFASEPTGARGARDESDFQSDFGDCSSVRDSAKTIFESRGEGPVRAVAWAGPCVAWANDRGVKIYDIAAQTPVAFIERPRGSPPPERYPPRLRWDGDATLLAGWADCVWVIAVSPRRDSAARRAEVLEQFQTEYVVAGIAPHGEDELAILAFLETPERDERGAASEKETTSTNRRVPPAFRPEMRVVRRRSAGAAETSRDALGVDGYAAFRPEEYALVSPSRDCGFGGATDARSESASPPRLAYLLASPKALVAARARTRAERIAWFSSRGDFDAALELCDEDERFGGGDDANTKTRSSKTSRDAVVTAYVEHLLRECGVSDADADADADVDAKREALCRLCPRLFRGDAALWEKWLFRFARGASERDARALLATIAPYVPTANPALSPEAYELILHAFLASPEDHARFLATVKAWPGSLYGVAGIVSAARRAVCDARESAFKNKKDAETPNTIATLREALAELYLLDGQRERALAAHLALGRPSVLDFVARHDLLPLVAADGDALRRAVAPLALLDPHKAAALFVDRRDVAPPELVAAHLARAAAETTGADEDLLDFREASESESRRAQTERSAARGGDLGARETYHLYLRRLFAVDKAACPTHRDAQTALFAEFHPEELGAFLRDASSALDLHEALRVVERFEAEARETASDLEGVDGFSETASAENAEEVAEDDAEDDGKNKNESESSVHWRRRQRLFASERASLLSRLGATRAALRVLVDAGDIARAVALTHERAAPDPRDALDEGDDELWDELIELVTERAKGEMVGKSDKKSGLEKSGDPFVSDSGKDSRASRSHLLAEGRGIGELLDVAGAVVDPSRVLARVPTGAPIDGLRARLVRVLAERRANARRARLARDVSARFLAKARRERLDAGRRAFPPARVVAED